MATRSRLLFVALLALLATAVLVVPAAAATESCDGERATIEGTPGDDTLTGTSQDDVIVGGGGDDSVNALAGDDRVCGGDGDDVITGGLGDDRLLGEGGVDGIHGGEGDDLIDGGPGDDRFDESVSASPTTAADESGLPFSGLDLPTFLVLGLALVGTWLLVSAALRLRRRRLARPAA